TAWWYLARSSLSITEAELNFCPQGLLVCDWTSEVIRYRAPNSECSKRRAGVPTWWKSVSESSLRFESKYKDTKTQRHRGARSGIFISAPLCLCVFVFPDVPSSHNSPLITVTREV